MGNGKLR